MSVEAVFLDFGGTLAYTDPTPTEIRLELLGGLGLRVERAALERAHGEATEALGPRIYDYHGRNNEFWLLFDGFILDRLRIPDPDGAVAEAIGRGFRHRRWFHAFPESHEVLESLRRKGYYLGIISNNVDEITHQMEALGLAKFFDTVTYSQEVGVDKPGEAIFRAALTRTRVTPEVSVHVGDTYEHDVAGARSVGITPILLDRGDRHPEADSLRIRDLRELEGLLESLS